MRILAKHEASKIDLDFIYGNGNAIAIVDSLFHSKYEIIKKK